MVARPADNDDEHPGMMTGDKAWYADVRFTDIAIRPFRTRQQGITFGLIDESTPDRGDWAGQYPDRLRFNPPWDGTYST